MIGNLSLRECTTVFYDVMSDQSDVYYFRVQMEPDMFRATFLNPVNIKVLGKHTTLLILKNACVHMAT